MKFWAVNRFFFLALATVIIWAKKLAALILRYRQIAIIIFLLIVVVISGTIAFSQRGRVAFSSPTIIGGKLPEKYTCVGENLNPPLTIGAVPSSTKSLAIYVENKNATKADRAKANNFLWLTFNIPPTLTKINEGIRPPGTVARDVIGNFNYTGPCPEKGRSATVVFHLYSLSTAALPINSGATLTQFLNAIRGRIIAEQTFSATYRRPR